MKSPVARVVPESALSQITARSSGMLAPFVRAVTVMFVE
jgi:hypothetical protein